MSVEQIKHAVRSAFLPGLLAILVSWMAVIYAHGALSALPQSLIWIFLILSPIPLAGSAPIIYWRGRMGYVLAAIGAVPALVWIHETESRSFFNSWIALNGSSYDRLPNEYFRYAELRILVLALSVVTLIWSITRLLPVGWRIRNHPVNQRTWPAMAIALCCLSYWFSKSVLPYREPVIVDGAGSELRLLHVTKTGLVFHETRFSLSRDGEYYLARSDRRLFQYRFIEASNKGALPQNLLVEMNNLKSEVKLERTETTAPEALRKWNGEGWYAESGRYAVSAFTSENSVPPPSDLVSFFRQVEAIPIKGQVSRYEIRDVCLGFCYDPRLDSGTERRINVAVTCPAGKKAATDHRLANPLSFRAKWGHPLRG